MKKLLARDLLKYTTKELKDILIGDFILKFDDGIEISSYDKDTYYNSFFWDFHRTYNKLPLLSTHHSNYTTKNKKLNYRKQLEIIFWDMVDIYNYKLPEERNTGIKLIYSILNNIYNELIDESEKYVFGTDALDLLHMCRYKGIKDVMDNIKPNKKSIILANRTIKDIVLNDVGFNDNVNIFATRIGSIKLNQLLQCIGPRGYPTEIDGRILPYPVTRGYAYGLRTMYNNLAESRTAAKSLYFNESPLRDAEYFSRGLLLINMVVEKIARSDCGSNKYINWKVKPPLYDNNNNLLYSGDLEYMVGKYYLDEDTNTLKIITSADKHLNNKLIKLRSSIYCNYQDSHQVCEICFGKLADNISNTANLGHITAATLTKQSGQSILSTKHVESSSVGNVIQLNEVARKVFNVGKDGNTYYLKKEIKGLDPKLIITKQSAFGLIDILQINDLYNISPNRISRIEKVNIIYGKHDLLIDVKHHTKLPMLTREFLSYCKIKGWISDNKGNFVIDLSEWDFTLPLLILPATEYNFSDQSNEIKDLIESKIKDSQMRLNPDSPECVLMELFDLVNTKLNVNLSIIEAIIYGYMINNNRGFKYGLARGSSSPGLGISTYLFRFRSLSSILAYEDQPEILTNPMSYFKGDRPDNPMDILLCPQEILKQ